jgi:hypothetical protein
MTLKIQTLAAGKADNRLMEFQPSPLNIWISSGNTYKNKP